MSNLPAIDLSYNEIIVDEFTRYEISHSKEDSIAIASSK